MGYITWKESFATGIKVIDEQHRSFVNFVNELYDAVQQGSGEVISIAVLQELTDYVREHFEAEERLLAAMNPALLTAQKCQHDDFLAELASFKGSPLEGHKCAGHMLLFLRDWFLNHIMSEDKVGLTPNLT